MTGMVWDIPTKADLKKLKLKRLVTENTVLVESLLDELNDLYKKDASIEKFVEPISQFLIASKNLMKALNKSAPKFCTDYEKNFEDPITKISKNLQSVAKYPKDIEKLLDTAVKNLTSLTSKINAQFDDAVLKDAIDLLFLANNGIGTVGSMSLELADELGIDKYKKAGTTLKQIDKTVSTIDKILVIAKDKQTYNFDKTTLIKAAGDVLSMTQSLQKDLAV